MKKLIGNKEFYKMIMKIAIPIIIQMGITNFVGLLDNVMVGLVGTEQMSGVAIVNTLIFVFNVCLFGGVSGAGIFGTQFYGKGDWNGVRNVFRFKIYICGIVGIVATILFACCDEWLISMFLHEGSNSGDLTATLMYGEQYLFVMLFGLFPFAIKEAYASTLKETEETLLPMKAGIIAVLINLGLNYVLIFGKFGAPALGVVGAAIATVISRYVEMLIVVVWTHTKREKNPFVVGLFHKLTIPAKLVKSIFLKGAPLFANELLWASGTALLTKCYSERGLDVVAATSMTSTLTNLFNVVFMSFGSVIAIVLGKLLGAGKLEEAKERAGQMIAFSVASCFVMGALLALISGPFTKVYNTTDSVRSLAGILIIISACCMPLHAFNHASYFTMRSGGKTFVTFLFDSVFVWIVSLPTAWLLVNMTDLHITWVYGITLGTEMFKCFIGFFLVKKGVWVQNIVAEQ